jgi:hypothetical protein
MAFVLFSYEKRECVTENYKLIYLNDDATASFAV